MCYLINVSSNLHTIDVKLSSSSSSSLNPLVPFQEHRASTMFFNLTLFWARALASCQVTPTLSRSCSVERLQLIFGLPCLLFPCGL